MIVETLSRGRWTVRAVRDENGACPLLVDLNAGPEEVMDKVLALLDGVAEHGPQKFPSNICHQIDGPIWQFRKRDLRILWFYDEGKVVICTHLFEKHVPKTPPGEIKRAKSEYDRYMAAKSNNTLEVIEDEEP